MISVSFGLYAATTAAGASSYTGAVDLTYPTAPSHTELSDDTFSAVSPIISPDVKAVALDFVKTAGLDKNLSLLLLDAAKNDVLVQEAIQQHGFDKVKAIVVRAITEERAAHAAAWTDMMAETYSHHLSAGQLSSIARGRTLSPFYQHLVEVQDEIAREVRDRGAEILAKAKSGLKSRIRMALGA